MLILLAFSSFGQNQKNLINLRLGTGLQYFNSQDFYTSNCVTQINIKYNNLFSSNLNLTVGKNLEHYQVPCYSFWESGFDFLISPFREQAIFDLKLGLGLSFHQSRGSALYPDINRPSIIGYEYYEVQIGRNYFGQRLVSEFIIDIFYKWKIGITINYYPFLRNYNYSNIILFTSYTLGDHG